MKRIVGYAVFGLIVILLQTTLLPRLLGHGPRPDLVLLLTLHIGLNERALPGAFSAWLLDVFSGTTFGLYGLILLLIFCAATAVGRQLNRDNSMVMVVATLFGTTGHALLLITTLLLFADADQGWHLVLRQLPLQLLFNLLAVIVLSPLFAMFAGHKQATARRVLS